MGDLLSAELTLGIDEAVGSAARPEHQSYFFLQVSSAIVVHLPSISAAPTRFIVPEPELRVKVSRDRIFWAPMCESPV